MRARVLGLVCPESQTYKPVKGFGEGQAIHTTRLGELGIVPSARVMAKQAWGFDLPF